MIKKIKNVLKELFLPSKNKIKEIKLTSLEEELKRLKSSLSDKNNKNASISYAFNNYKDMIYEMSSNREKFKPRYRFILEDIYKLL